MKSSVVRILLLAAVLFGVGSSAFALPKCFGSPKIMNMGVLLATEGYSVFDGLSEQPISDPNHYINTVYGGGGISPRPWANCIGTVIIRNHLGNKFLEATGQWGGQNTQLKQDASARGL